MINRNLKFDIDIIINTWEAHNSSLDVRYKKNLRCKLIEELCENVYIHGYSVQDLMFEKKRVVGFLVSEDGRKYSGKKKHDYKTWLDNANNDFDDTVSSFFMQKYDEGVYGSPEYLEKRVEIERWVKEKLKTEDSAVIKEAHKLFGSLMMEWAQETLMK